MTGVQTCALPISTLGGTTTDGTVTWTTVSMRGNNNIILGYDLQETANTADTLNIGNVINGNLANKTIGIATTTFNGIFGIGTDSGSATTTISAGKIQWDGYNSAGTRICAYFVGTTLTTQTGKCNP